MDVPPKTPTEILRSTIDSVDTYASAIQDVIEANLSPESTPHSVQANTALLEIERIISALRQVTMEAEDQLGFSEVGREGTTHVHVSDEDNVSPDDLLPCDYDPDDDPPYVDDPVESDYESDRSWHLGYRKP
jgi:hypothetical protein